MKTLRIFAAIAGLCLLCSCQFRADSTARRRDTLAGTQSNLVTAGDRLPIYFDLAASTPEPLSPSVWRNVFSGDAAAKAKLRIVDESSVVGIENFGFSTRFDYSIRAALEHDGKTIIVSASDSAAGVFVSTQTIRDCHDRVALSIARQCAALMK